MNWLADGRPTASEASRERQAPLEGATAAWLAGLTRGGRPLSGAPRVAGILGACIAVLDMVLAVGGVILSALI